MICKSELFGVEVMNKKVKLTDVFQFLEKDGFKKKYFELQNLGTTFCIPSLFQNTLETLFEI